MRFKLFFTYCILSFAAYSQTETLFSAESFLLNQPLKIDQLIGTTDTIASYTLRVAVDTPRYDYGNRLEFKDTLFYSFYTAPCGNDYFTSVYGLFRIIDNRILEINPIEISYHGEWDPPKPKEFPEKNWQRFQVIKTKEGAVLKRL